MCSQISLTSPKNSDSKNAVSACTDLIAYGNKNLNVIFNSVCVNLLSKGVADKSALNVKSNRQQVSSDALAEAKKSARASSPSAGELDIALFETISSERVPYALCRQRRSSIEARALRRLPSSYGISVSLKPVIRNYLRDIIGPQKHIA